MKQVRFGWVIFMVCLSWLPGQAQKKVEVVNHPSNPVPVAVKGTPTVNVNGTVPVSGNVNATVTGNVGIFSNTTVNVQSRNAPPAVINGQTITPVVVRDLDEHARHPFQRVFLCSTGSNSSCSDSSFTVPAGKELVIEYLQFGCVESAGSTVLFYQLTTTSGGDAQAYTYPRGTVTTANFPVTHELTRLYADPGTTITFGGFGSGASLGFSATVSGYMIDVP